MNRPYKKCTFIKCTRIQRTIKTNVPKITINDFPVVIRNMPVSWLKMNNSAHQASHHVKKCLMKQQVSKTK